MLALHVNQDYHTTIIIIPFCLVSRLALCLFLFLLHQRSSASPCSFSSPCLCLASHSRFLSSTIHAGVYYWRKTQGVYSLGFSVSCHICLLFLSWVTCFSFAGNCRFSFLSWNLFNAIMFPLSRYDLFAILQPKIKTDIW